MKPPRRPYKKTTHDGNTVNWRTKAMLLEMERILGYELTVIQGSYNSGVSASAGTHDGGGAVDLSAFDWNRKVRAGRKVGFDMWHRPDLPGEWNEHIHGIAHGDKQMSSGARSQQTQYHNHTDGLAGHGPDRFPFHPNDHEFNYKAWRKMQIKKATKKTELEKIMGWFKDKDAFLDSVANRARAGVDSSELRAEVAALRKGESKRDVATFKRDKATSKALASVAKALAAVAADVEDGVTKTALTDAVNDLFASINDQATRLEDEAKHVEVLQAIEADPAS